MLIVDKNIRASFRRYRKNNENTIIDSSRYIKMCRAFNTYMMDSIIEGNNIQLPAKLGRLYITGRKIEIAYNEDGKPNLAIDWQKTKKMWAAKPQTKIDKKVLYHTNDNTNGVRYKLVWSKKDVKVEHKNFYSMRLSRRNKKKITLSIKSGKEYFISPPAKNSFSRYKH